MDTPNLNQITDLTNTQRANTQNFQNGQNSLTSDFLNRYTGAINNQETSTAMANRIGGELNLPTLQKNANTINNTISNIPTTYSKATTGYDVNANQLSRIIGQKTSDLAPAATTANNALSSAQSTLNTQMGYQQADQAKALQPYQTEQSLLSDRLARESSMYSQENQNELDGLIAKTNAGITLSEGEKNRQQELAISEQNYEHAKEAASTANTNANNSSTQIVETGGRKKLINSITGQVIQDLGPSGSGVATPAPNPNQYIPTDENNGLTSGGSSIPASFQPDTPTNFYNPNGSLISGLSF